MSKRCDGLPCVKRDCQGPAIPYRFQGYWNVRCSQCGALRVVQFDTRKEAMDFWMEHCGVEVFIIVLKERRA